MSGRASAAGGADPRDRRAGATGRALARRRSMSIVIAIAALLNAAGCVAGQRARESATPQPIRVMVYNIHAGKDGNGVHNLSRVAELVGVLRADVVLLQEVDRRTQRSGGEDQLATLSLATGMHGVMGKTLDYQGGEYGIAILSRWPIVRDTLIRLPVTPEQVRGGGSREPRGAQVAAIEHPAGPIVVINTHLDASREDHWRRQEAEHLLAIATSAGTGAMMVLVGGDINSTPESEVQQLIRAGGLRDSWTMCGSGDGHTFRADSLVRRIDYLYLTGDTRCRKAEVIATLASDHVPLLVQVEPPR
jgi:endonuclease/exonuclease/phosphatase family metal-dependent hydrolase